MILRLSRASINSRILVLNTTSSPRLHVVRQVHTEPNPDPNFYKTHEKQSFLSKKFQKFKENFVYQNLDIKLMFLSVLLFIGYYGYKEHIWNVHKNNKYHETAIQEILKNKKLKYANGGDVIFKGFMKNGENCLTKDVARVIFYTEGANKKPGLCLCEAVFDEETLAWELSRVYLDFWPYPDRKDAPPVHIQVFPSSVDQLVIPENNKFKRAKDQWVMSDKIMKPELKINYDEKDPKVRDEAIKEALKRKEDYDRISEERRKAFTSMVEANERAKKDS